MKSVIKMKLLILIFCTLGIITTAWADQIGDKLMYTFKGQFILSSPCKVNDDKVLEVPFGNIAIDNIDGIQYKKIIPYTVDCQGATDDSPLSIKVIATAVSFDNNAAIATNVDGLGIEIQANGLPMPLNKPLLTTLSDLSSLELTATPVKDSDAVLTEQAFSAGATLTVDYQ